MSFKVKVVGHSSGLEKVMTVSTLSLIYKTATSPALIVSGNTKEPVIVHEIYTKQTQLWEQLQRYLSVIIYLKEYSLGS